MKKIISILLTSFFALALKAQIILTKAYTPPNGNYYFELQNNGTNPVSLDCYSLLSYYKNSSEMGFYVINLPARNLSARGVLTLGTTYTSTQGYSNGDALNLKNLFAEGLLQKFVINQSNSSFFNNTPLFTSDDFYNQLVNTTEFDDHIVLLFNGNILMDASFTVDANKNLSHFLNLLPNLSFSNTCGNLVTVRFGALQSLYATIFNRPNQSNEYGYFKEFEVRRNNASVQIAWQTIREQNNRGFEIERRTENRPWTTVAYVASMAQSGNGSETLNYLYGDNTLLKGNLQYRLKQIDINGRAYYSNVQTLNSLGEIDNVAVYPNPTTDGRVNIAFGSVNALRDIQVLDINGQLIQQRTSVNTITQQIDNLRRGNYIIRVIDRLTGTVSTEKLIVQ